MSRVTPLDIDLEIDLAAAIVAMHDHVPHILVATKSNGNSADKSLGLPSGPFHPLSHRTFEIGLRQFVTEQTGFSIGYVEQLYTFGDRGRHAMPSDLGPHIVSVGYLALTHMSPRNVRAENVVAQSDATFVPWYRFFPWEDWRAGRPCVLDYTLIPQLELWASAPEERELPSKRSLTRQERVRLCFGLDGAPWDEEKHWSAMSCCMKRGFWRSHGAMGALLLCRLALLPFQRVCAVK
jgi:hypothetical protein